MTESLVNEEEQVMTWNEECLKGTEVVLQQCRDYVQVKVASPKQKGLWNCLVYVASVTLCGHLILLLKQQKPKPGVARSV